MTPLPLPPGGFGRVSVVAHKARRGHWTFALRWRIGGQAVRSDGYVFLFRTEPDPTRPSLREWRRKAAEAAAAKESELHGGLAVAGPPKPIPEAIAEYLQWLAGGENHAAQVSSSSLRRTRRIMGRLALYLHDRWPGVMNVADLTSRQFDGASERSPGWRYAREQDGAKASTIRTEMWDLAAWLKWCVKRGYLPARIDCELPPLPPRAAITIPGDEQVRAVIQHENPTAGLAFALAALAGLRRGEVEALDRADWDPGRKVLIVRDRGTVRTKLHGRELPVGPRLAGTIGGTAYALQASPCPRLIQANGQPLNGHMNRWLKGRGFTPHDLRRWFVNALTGARIPQLWIDMLTGHAPDRTDAAYVRPTMDELRAVMVGLEDRLFAAPVRTPLPDSTTATVSPPVPESGPEPAPEPASPDPAAGQAP